MEDLIQCAVIFAGSGMTLFLLGWSAAWLCGLFETIADLDG
jgi:hypothetical protein